MYCFLAVDLIKEPTEAFKNLWEGKVVSENPSEFNRFTFDLKPKTCMQIYIFHHLANMRNMFTKRVLNTVGTYLTIEDEFGLGELTREEKLDSLVRLVTNGLNRCGEDNLTTLPIFYAFSIESEIDFKFKAFQRNLLSRQIKREEFSRLNNKKVEDVLMSSDVATIILVICNNVVRILFFFHALIMKI